MPPEDCIEKGCTARMDRLEEDRDHLIDPENGALPRINARINTKVSWASLFTILGAFLLIVFGAYAYTTLTVQAVESRVSRANDMQDKRVDELRSDIIGMQQEIVNMDKSVQAALASINEHRAYTEGYKPPKRP